MSNAFSNEPGETTPQKGPIAWFARNHVAANLLFFLLIMLGAISVLSTKLEVFPSIDPRIVSVNIPYPGANPEEVEKGVIRRVEEAVADVEGVKDLNGIAVESQAVVTIEATNSVDMKDFYEDIKAAVDRIDSFPTQAEEPVVTQRDEGRFQVATVALFGDVSRRDLKETAEQMKDELQQTGSVSQITIDGIPPYEIAIEVDQEKLRELNLTFADVSRAVRASSLDLPAGNVEGNERELLVRSVGQAYNGDEFEQIIVRRLPDGTTIRIGDIATVIDGFEDSDFQLTFDGKPAALLNVYRIGDEGALNVAATVQAYLKESKTLLPAGIDAAMYNDSSEALLSRINLMLKNAVIGLILVVILLGLFLDLRLAFWAAAGLTMSVVASFTVLPLLDVSINMISLFAFILVLGILVDDAVIVGENIHAHREMGKSAARAAIDGTREVALPVTMTILTTVMAFTPLLFAGGTMGQILAVIPVVVISVLVISLVECLFVLPAHLSGEQSWEPRLYTWVRTKLSSGMEWFVQKPYNLLLTWAVRLRYITVSISVSVLLLSFALLLGGILPWTFFPSVEADIVSATVEMPPGTSSPRTDRVVRQLALAAEQVEREFKGEVKHIQVANGGYPYSDVAGGPGGPPAIASRDPRIGEVILELKKGEERNVSADVVADRWAEIVGTVPGVRKLEFRSELLSPGDPINVQLRSQDSAVLRQAADYLKDELAKFDGVREISDDFQDGKPEFQITNVSPLGDALGLTPRDISEQVRAAFFGEEAQRVQRGRDEVRVYVRSPESSRKSISDIENLYIRLPDGTEAPLRQVAEYTTGEGYSAINRKDRRRVVAVSADVDTSVVSSNDLNAKLTNEILPTLISRYPKVSWSMEGEAQEQAESMESLGLAMIVAMVGIYAMLAVLFRSYVQPLVVMAAIPFGFAGAIFGHVLLDQFVRPTPLSFLSMFGVVALSGVVVNDSLILIDLINRNRMRDGDSTTGVQSGVIEAGLRRFRPIFLTTVTTFFGLVPIILETSLQAQFIIPMAVSLGFGIVFATSITLLIVPALYMIVEDVRTILMPVFGNRVRYDGPAFQMGAASD